ncbi:expressed unknown protein [Seminavis robusta]|uniref:Uncharacterized protein n=1 Tax=Seminavis robusta TaxID=568900 RepID=A0A9N8EC28_9STRA|nr:expressed unknown protein [Seminavis robusta]|eukprot:Sro789_g202700.1 n/a (249) ;mRNA; f:36773-37519
MSKTRKSERRHRAAESLGDHFEGEQSAEVDCGYEDEDVAESWSSHDISAGAVKPSGSRSRRSSTGGGSKGSSGTSSSRRRDSARKSATTAEGRSKSPSGNSTKSDRSSRNGSKRDIQSSPRRTSATADALKSPYKALSKLTIDDGSAAVTPRRSKKGTSAGSGIPRAPVASPGGSSRKSSSSRDRVAGEGSSSSIGSSRRTSEAAGGGENKLQRILELGNQWKNMKQQHEMAAQQATSRRVDLTKEIF